MKIPKESDKIYGQKVIQPTSCPGCHTRLTKINKSGYRETAFVCWNLGECRLAKDLTRMPSWEIVSEK